MIGLSEQVSLRGQYAFYTVLSLGALVLTVAALPSSRTYFSRFLGGADPILVTVVAAILGAASLHVLQSRFGFMILRGHQTPRGIALSALLATALAVAIVVADLIIHYPQDLNTPMPQALLFYPAIGFVAEMAFHVLPLAIVLVAMSPLAGRMGDERLVWLGILVVAVVEPTFQILLGGNALSWSDAYTWIHVFAIAALQLYVFRRFDFASMFSFRLVYYAYWHIVWGVLRLDVLF